MDERRLTELFQDAADSAGHHAPPPSFSHEDVVAGSRRAQQRAHRLQTGAIAVVVLGLAAAGVVSAGVLNTSSNGSTTLAEPAAPAAAPEAPDAGSAPGAESRVAAPFSAEKRDARDSCAVPDQALFNQLAELVPAVRGATPRPVSDEAYCPDGARGVEVDVTDGDAHGVLRVLLSPPGSLGGGSNIQTGGGSQSTSTSSTRGGGSLSVTSSSRSGDAPFEDDLDDLADKLADRN